MTWDYIIIGAGSAGCSLAHQLAKSGRNASILVLEAGGSDRSPFIKIPAGVGRACTTYDWGYQAEPDPSRHGAVEDWLRGKVLGGCSSVNGTIYVRGATSDFNRWAEQCGNEGHWSAREVIPIFRDLETSDQVGPLRGRTGPLRVRTVKRPHVITTAFIESACSAGYVRNEDYNGDSQEGIGYMQLTQHRGFRCSAADAFLKPHLGAGRNLELLLNAVVERIEIENGAARGVVFSRRGKQCRESARDVILCAGAINSPKLLMLSGVGDAKELESHGIRVVLHSPGVGRNLRDHPMVRMTYRASIPTYNPTEGLLQKLGIAAKFALTGEGPISNLFESMAFLKSTPSKPEPDLQLFFITVGHVKTAGSGWALTPYPGVMVYVANSYPVASGRVRLRTANPSDSPLIEYRMLEHRADVDAMIRGVETIRRIMGTEPIARLIAEEVVPGNGVADRAAIEEFIQKESNICYHTIGTCRMGIGSDAVVGPDLRVKSTKNLWIADASIMPDPISANLNAACMMIGAKLGRQLVTRGS